MKPIPYGLQWVDQEDIAEVTLALRSDRITQGPLIKKFEESVAALTGARFGVAFSSGTAALHGSCFAAGIAPGDEVITTPLTFVATPNAVVYQGGVPVLADIHPETLNIDPAKILEQITPRTKAILPVHFAGLPCAMEPIYSLAREKGLTVIEDACHALGAEWTSCMGKRERVGSCTHSDMTVFSFHPVKHVTTGEGGMVLTNREDFRDRLKLFRHHGIVKQGEAGEGASDEPWRCEMHFLGYNYRITDFQCALGIRQLEKLERFLLRRDEIARAYDKAFAGLELVSPLWDHSQTRHAWHLYVVQLPLERFRVNRGTIFRLLQDAGLGVNVHYLPVHLHPYYQKKFSYRLGDYPVAERYYARAITLPLFPKMTDEDVERVIETVWDVFQTYQRPKSKEAIFAAPGQEGVGWRPAN